MVAGRGQIAEHFAIGGGQIGQIRDPHRAVLHRVDAALVGNRGVVVLAVLPDRRMASTDRRCLGIVDRRIDVVAGQIGEGLRSSGFTSCRRD